MAPLRLAIVAPSGSGKSTTADFIVQRCLMHQKSARIIKLAEPLYRLQREFYTTAGENIETYQQNQKLLEDIATHLRAIRPTSLVDNFTARLVTCDDDVIINDDLRDPEIDLPMLRCLGFQILRVSASNHCIASRLDQRGDLQTQRSSVLDQTVQRIRPDHVLVNCGCDLQSYREDVFDFTDFLLREASELPVAPMKPLPLRQVATN